MIQNENTPISKVLVHDCNPDDENTIKMFCDSHSLVTVKSQGADIIDVLKSYVDLGAIFISADLHGVIGKGIEMGKIIHNLRPELPIFLKITPGSTYEDESLLTDKVFSKIYEIDNIDIIQPAIDQQIFCSHYPNALIRGIEEVTRNSLKHFFSDAIIEVSSPYLVKDRIIFGELFSLIPIESGWCKGYMMLQSQEGNVREMVAEEKIEVSDINPDNFRIVNDIVSEITNMTWGGIRNRFILNAKPNEETSCAEVPIVVNHEHKYITFGTDSPQLCFRYTIKKSETTAFTLFIKFVFNLYWKPENFAGDQPSVNELVESGELEFF